ncbi:UvrB/UvrC motif-containing protein [Macrococcus animalis]|uniref:UvrB/UvrC motif-containing protein n=1 Tax=Macrococcus animalis TaxID=3395467 RepID=UPI0039BED054
MQYEEEFSMNQLLKHLLNSGEFHAAHTPDKCPNCGLTLREALHIGKFGCHECYNTFSDYVPQVIERVQAGNLQHVGVTPHKSQEKIALKKKIEALENKLKILVDTQAFEEAVVVRDEIRALKEGGDTNVE